VPLDRTATLHDAEKLLRQGKLDQAISEYARVVEEFPRDWNTANILGDLYIRAKQADKAVEQFIRIGDHLSEEGFLSKAGALYKKALKVKPDHEHALVQAAEIAGNQGILVDARSYFKTLADLRRARNDSRGVAQVVIRLGSLDPADYEARVAAARARVEIGDVAGALTDYKTIAAELAEKGRQGDAVAALSQAAALDPDDTAVRTQLVDLYMAAGDFAKARQSATSAAQLKSIAARLTEAQQPEQALLTLRDAARLDPSDLALKAHLARTFVERGDMDAAAEYLTVETAGDDPSLRLTLAEIQLRRGRADEGLAIVRGLLAQEVARRQDIALLGLKLAEHAPDVAFQVVGMSADAAVGESDWPSAAAALQEFVTRQPTHLAALMRLVEICVDGGLEATMYSAQAQLADAYIAAGQAAEARFIAEDLVAREPWDRANIERFRKALVLMGEDDPDGIIAERLSGESPFVSTDASLSFDELPPFEAPAPLAAATVPDAAPATASVDLGSLFDDFSVGAGAGHSDVEVDLSIVLNDIREPAVVGAAMPHPAPKSDDPFLVGAALHKAGKLEDAIPHLETASRTPALRFQSASLLGRIYRAREMKTQAVEWLERAARAPAPSFEDYHQLLFELADLLESTGDAARALSLYRELHADAGDYRDVAARVDRLTKVQMRG
jgi:tetratricopeptide (TPR) repeat protein